MPDLSPRQLEVLSLLAAGLAVKQIALRLHLSPKTVENHKTALFLKLGTSTSAGAVHQAHLRGLLQPDPAGGVSSDLSPPTSSADG